MSRSRRAEPPASSRSSSLPPARVVVRRAAERLEHLAVGGMLIADRAPEPLTGAEEVPAVDLGDVLDSLGPGHGQVDRLSASRRRARRAPACDSSTRLRSSMPRSATRRIAGPGRRRPRSPSCSIRPRRSSALTSREVVLFGSPAADASSLSATGSSLSSTRTSRSAPRSIAAVPCAGGKPTWNCCSTRYRLRIHAARSTPRGDSPRPDARSQPCSSTRCPATRSSAKTRWP